MSASQSQSSQATSTSTRTIADSYNRTFNEVYNLSNTGNVSLAGLGSGGDDSTASLKVALPWLFGISAVLGIVMFFRK